MGRPSNRVQRRAEIVQAFASVLAEQGYAGATMVVVAARAGVSPGLLHHHFRDKRDMLDALLEQLARGFVARAAGGDLESWVDGALGLEPGDVVAARCWVGVMGEALREPSLLQRLQQLVGVEVRALQHRGQLGQDDAVALMAMTVGYLVVGAFRPDLTRGQAARQASRLSRLLSERPSEPRNPARA